MQLKRIGSAFDRIHRIEQNSNLEKIEQAVNGLVNGNFEEAALNTLIGQKLNELEVRYTPKLTEVSAQLMDKVNVEGVLNIVAPKADKTYVDTIARSLASGSPKGVFPTLAALQGAFPIGNNNIYVVSTDGNWYYWNDEAWVSGGLYQSASVADRSITAYKTDFIEVSKNLFDKSKVTSGYYVRHSDGTLQPNVNFSVSDFIRIDGGGIYTISFFNQVAFYNADKVYISGIDGYNAGIKTVTTPQNAFFIRVSIYNNALNVYQLEKGSASTNYEPFGVYLPRDFLDNETRTVINKIVKKPKTIKEVMKRLVLENGLQVKLIGDSITAGVGGTGYNLDGEIIYDNYRVNTSGFCWANLLRDYLQSKFSCTVKNFGISGRNSWHIKTNLASLIENEDDIVICMIGTNDRNTQANISQVAYRDNLKTIYDYVRGLGKDIIFMSNIPASVANETDISNPKSYHMEDIDNNVMVFSAENNMEYVSLYKAFLNYCDVKGVSIDSLLADGLHPNDNGYKVMFNLICDELGIGRKRIDANW